MTTSKQHPTFFAIFFTCTLLFFMPLLALGLTLDEAKQRGLLGERPDGYLGLATTTVPAKTVELMREINRKRREVYLDIASKNGTNLSTVQALAGKKAIDKTASGQLIMQPNGTWTPKP